MEKEDFLLSQIDEFREKAKQLQNLLTSKESKVQELQNLVNEREDKAQELEQILSERQEEAVPVPCSPRMSINSVTVLLSP